jgi:pSer/pThr/pTyr-binding forkhead associated (FHA) protein
MACLVWDSPGGRKVFALDRAVMVVGRDSGSDLHLPDKTVSRRHALLQVDEDRVRLTDLGSTSKTRINGAALVRDVPSTLEAGDVVHVGKLELTFHPTTPPSPPGRSEPRARAKAGKPKSARPKRERATASSGAGPWKAVAVGLAFVVVVLLAAFLATRGNEPPTTVVLDGSPETPPDERPEPGTGDASKPGPEEQAEPEPQPEPEPEPEPETERAPAGALPPGGYAPVEDFPDLLEVDGKDYFAVAVVSFGADGIEVRGRDGRVYALARREVTRILDRADLVRRVAVQRAGLARDDVESRLQLAQWCAQRYVPTEALQLLDEVLELQPDHEAARALRARLESGR